MNIKKLSSLLICGFTVLGASFNSMAMKENNENTNLIDNSIQREPELSAFTENMLEECKTKNKKMFRVPYNDRWLLVNGDLSPFRMGTEEKKSDQNFFYYSVSGNDNDLTNKINKHPVQPCDLFGYSQCFKLPLSNDPSKSIIVEYCEAPKVGEVSCVYENNGGELRQNYLKKTAETCYKFLSERLARGEIEITEYLKIRMGISGGFKLNKNYLFETKNLFFLRDISKESEESEIGRWFKENKNEIESYAKGFPWGKAVASVGTAVLLEELIRRNLPEDKIDEDRSDDELEKEKLTDQETDLEQIETEDED